MKKISYIFTVLALISLTSCVDVTDNEPAVDSGGAKEASAALDKGTICSDPKGDFDGDGIENGVEGCLSARDSDGDKTPDWQDFDSDGDGINDSAERGDKDSGGKCKSTGKAWPCDSDGDGVPDYLDQDSDNDGLRDKEEDENGDGELGCCLRKCNTPATDKQKKCTLTKDGCGSGQKCVSGLCTPVASFLCSEGETDPRKKDTFGDGQLDDKRGTYICRDATEDKPLGRKPVQLRNDKAGDWHIAVERTAKYGKLTLSSGPTGAATAVVDYEKSPGEVAGFVVSMASSTDIQNELAALLVKINSFSSGGTVTVQASGTQGKSHDKYDTITGTQLLLKAGGSQNVSTVRNELVAALLGVSTGQLGNLPAGFGATQSSLVIRFSTVKRFEFKKDSSGNLVKDAKGYPMDGGDTSKWRLVVMGAVAGDANYRDPKRTTGILVDDLSNGTALALASDTVGNECDANTVNNIPRADMLWVSDESGSMNDNRIDVTANAAEFFKRALAMGLDFRMGITNVVPKGKTGYGTFCSRVSTNKSDSGGTDRFLLPSEQAAFVSCIKNPPGYTNGASPGEYGLINAKAALTGHLPRATSDPTKFRKDASIIIIVLTDQVAAVVNPVFGSYTKAYNCKLSAADNAQIATLLQPYINLFNGSIDPEAAVSKFFVLGGVCNNKCRAMLSYGYVELINIFGGQIGDVCQKNLTSTMQAFLDSIVAGASPVRLDHVPISSSLAVTVDGLIISRSRTAGFDYRSANNSLVFITTKYQKGSKIFASYKRWERQVIIK